MLADGRHCRDVLHSPEVIRGSTQNDGGGSVKDIEQNQVRAVRESDKSQR